MLSAEHGLLPEAALCPAYDRVLVPSGYRGRTKDGSPVRRVDELVPRLRQQRDEHELPRALDFVGGKLYAEALVAAGYEVRSLSAAGIGYKRAALREYLESAAPGKGGRRRVLDASDAHTPDGNLLYETKAGPAAAFWEFLSPHRGWNVLVVPLRPRRIPLSPSLARRVAQRLRLVPLPTDPDGLRRINALSESSDLEDRALFLRGFVAELGLYGAASRLGARLEGLSPSLIQQRWGRLADLNFAQDAKDLDAQEED